MRMKPVFRSIFIAAAGVTSTPAIAQTRQDDVLRSIQQNVGESVDPTHLVAALAIIGCIIVTILLVNVLRKRAARPKVVNHRGKLLKEMTRTLNLKSAEMRQLKTLAESEELASPLVLLLCPSLLNKSVKSAGDRVDRSAIGSLARRLASK